MARLLRKAIPLALIMVGIYGCQATPDRLEVIWEPRFTSATDNYPPTQPGYPQGQFVHSATWGTACVDEHGNPIKLSGFDFMLRFNPPAALSGVPSAVVVQDIIHRNTRRHHTCADPLTDDPAKRYLEYFNPPNNDVQWQWIVPETQDKFLDGQARVACFPLPGSVSPVASGQNAEFINDSYAKWTATQQHAFDKSIVTKQFVTWLINWQYDACHTPRDTPTRTRHWMLLRWSPVDAAAPGAPRDKGPWQGEGKAW